MPERGTFKPSPATKSEPLGARWWACFFGAGIVIVAITFFVAGCAVAPSAESAMRGANAALNTLDIAVEGAVKLHEEGARAAIAHCRATLGRDSSPQQRELCLRSVGYSPDQVDDRVQAALTIREAYDAIADSLDEIEAQLPKLVQGVEAAKAVPK